MDYFFLANTALFRGIATDEVQTLLQCLGFRTKTYEKGAVIYHAGETAATMGLICSGSVVIACCDLWGNNSVLDVLGSGQLFSEAYACIPSEPMMVSVTACKKSEILFLNIERLLTTCSHSCAYHNRLVQNLLHIFAQKNLGLSRRVLHTSPKSIRGRLLSYLSEQAKKNGSYCFTIPFNRQQLADYLGVDRSALSNALSKMQQDGLLTYDRNAFTLMCMDGTAHAKD